VEENAALSMNGYFGAGSSFTLMHDNWWPIPIAPGNHLKRIRLSAHFHAPLRFFAWMLSHIGRGPSQYSEEPRNGANKKSRYSARLAADSLCLQFVTWVLQIA
jgi:hypothetical protein